MTLDQLYDQIYSDKTTKQSDNFIGIYESNKDLIENQALETDKEVYSKVMRLTSDYAHHLAMNDSFTKALPYIDKSIGLIEEYPDFKGSDLFKIEFYETLLFDRARANYSMKKFKAAEQDLKLLSSRFPDNDIYKNWLSETQTHSLKKVENVLWFILILAMFGAIFLDNEFGTVHNVMFYIGVAALISGVTVGIFRRQKQKRIKNAA